MVHNPIYDGPVYESVRPQFETLTGTLVQTSDHSDCLTSTPTTSLPPCSSLNNTARYIDQPSQFRSKSFSSNVRTSAPCDTTQPTNASVSTNVTDLKNEEELHLTLFFINSDHAVGAHENVIKASEDASSVIVPRSEPLELVDPVVLSDKEESYTVMSPTGTLLTKMKTEM